MPPTPYTESRPRLVRLHDKFVIRRVLAEKCVASAELEQHDTEAPHIKARVCQRQGHCGIGFGLQLGCVVRPRGTLCREHTKVVLKTRAVCTPHEQTFKVQSCLKCLSIPLFSGMLGQEAGEESGRVCGHWRASYVKRTRASSGGQYAVLVLVPSGCGGINRAAASMSHSIQPSPSRTTLRCLQSPWQT